MRGLWWRLTRFSEETNHSKVKNSRFKNSHRTKDLRRNSPPF